VRLPRHPTSLLATACGLAIMDLSPCRIPWSILLRSMPERLISSRASALSRRKRRYSPALPGLLSPLRRGSEIVCRARTGRTAPDIGVRLQTDSGLSAECVRTGEVLLCHDAESNPRVDWASCRRMGVRSILVAPLRHFGGRWEFLRCFSSTPHAFDNNDVATMQFLSGMMVATISRLSSFAAGGARGLGRVTRL